MPHESKTTVTFLGYPSILTLEFDKHYLLQDAAEWEYMNNVQQDNVKKKIILI